MAKIDFSELPAEVLLKILTFLTPTDLISFSSASEQLCNVCQIDSLWRLKIKETYNVEPDQYLNIADTPIIHTAKTYFDEIFSKYGYTLGFWSKQNYKGTILRVKFIHGCMIFSQILVSKEFSEELDSVLLMTIDLDEDGACKHSYHFKNKVVNDRFISFEYRKNDHEETLTLSTVLRPSLISVKSLRNFKTEIFSRLHVQNSPDHSNVCNVLDSGLYKGTYSSEGVELIKVFYGKDDFIIGQKITGDQFVPSGKVSFKVNLTCPLHPTENQRQRMAALRLTNVCQDLNCLCPKEFPLQPFQVPFDCRLDIPGYQYPLEAIAWFKAEYTIAYPNFTHPETILAHMVVFNRRQFCLVIFQLDERTVFNRLSIFEKIELL